MPIFCRFQQVVSIENPNSDPMPSDIQNEQDSLAEKFRQHENQVIQECKVALLKIQSWQFAARTPEIGQSYLKEAAIMIQQSLLSFVPNSYVLSEEGFYLGPIEN